MLAREVLKNSNSFAVIGVTTNEEKYGYRIYKYLKEINKTVYGVSPIYDEVDGDTTYPNLKAIQGKVDVAVFVVSPKFGMDYVKECIDLGIEHIWLQPGTYDNELIALIKENNLNHYLNCVLVEGQFL